MNILVCSAGRRAKIVEYIKKELKSVNGRVIATDCDKNAPALYFADDIEIVPKVDSPNYIEVILDICRKHNINGIFSLIDPELEILASHENLFNENQIKLIQSPLETIQICFDKQKTYDSLQQLSLPGVPTYSDIKKVEELIDSGELKYPLIVKPRKGSASIGIEVIYSKNELVNIFSKDDNLIIQPYYKEREFGIDVYIDLLNGELIDIFIKEKLRMRSGETDKSISIHNNRIEALIKDFILKFNFKGPIDIDCFEYKGEYYISEINPRFGGGYPHAYEMGCNFMEYILCNIKGEQNKGYSGYKYNKDYIMMKYDEILLQKS